MRNEFHSLPKPLSGESITIRDLGDVQIYAHSDDIVASSELESGNDVDAFSKMIVLAARKGRVVAIDVGCNYGIQLCRLANIIKSETEDFSIVGLDPGRAGQLVPFTLRKNGLQDDIQFIPAAAWRESGVVEVYAEDGNSLNNRILPSGATEVQWLASSLTLSQIIDLSKPQENCPIFAKVDTQGADLEVLMGAGEYLPHLAGVTELTPWACDKRVNIPEFLEEILVTHRLFDLGDSRQRNVEIFDVPAFLHKIYVDSPYWTDVLFVPRLYPWLID